MSSTIKEFLLETPKTQQISVHSGAHPLSVIASGFDVKLFMTIPSCPGMYSLRTIYFVQTEHEIPEAAGAFIGTVVVMNKTYHIFEGGLKRNSAVLAMPIPEPAMLHEFPLRERAQA